MRDEQTQPAAPARSTIPGPHRSSESAPQLPRHTVSLDSLYRTPRRKAGVEPSVGSRGNSYDNALAESVIAPYRTQVINRGGPWRTVDAVELATLAWGVN